MANDEQNLGESSKIRVLLVEDHVLTRIGLKTVLARTSDIMVVGEADNGLDAIAKVEELHPDVVLMDVGMPVMDGIEAADKLRNSHPEVNIIMLTSHDNDQDIFASLAAGAGGYCLKDVMPERLYMAIRSVKAGDIWLDSAIASRVIRLYNAPRARQAQNGSQSAVTSRPEQSRPFNPQNSTQGAPSGGQSSGSFAFTPHKPAQSGDQSQDSPHAPAAQQFPPQSPASHIAAPTGSGSASGQPATGSFNGENVGATENPTGTASLNTAGTTSGTISGTIPGTISGTVPGTTAGALVGATANATGNVPGFAPGPADPDANSNLTEPLSPRELEVLALLVEGLSNQEIADRLIISLATAKTHVRNILNKMAVDDRTQAAVLAMRRGLV